MLSIVIVLYYICYTSYNDQLSPEAAIDNDTRPPHIISSNTKAIAKTALGAEISVPMRHVESAALAIAEAKLLGFKIIVVEQSEISLNLYEYHPEASIALVLGNEVSGVSQQIMALADTLLEIPMLGTKESLNVSVAAAVVMYQLRYGCV
jgi:23S rRNA (guanosine2251-2'-O)-methyltransferase